MGAMVALMLTGLVGAGIYKFFTSSEKRAAYIKEFQDDPLGAVFALLMVACAMACFWGVMIPRFGEIPVNIFGAKLAIWSAGGIGFLIFLGLLSWQLGRKNQ